MKKNILNIGGIVALALLLMGAAFMGGRLLNGNSTTNGPGLFSGGDQVPEGILPAKELPQTPADVLGVFDHRQDKSIFVVTGLIPDVVSGPADPKTLASGPTLEVVVTTQTKIYRDATSKQFNGPPPNGQKPQQVVESGSLVEIGESSILTVWGRRTGDRLIAEVLVYANPTLDHDPE